MKGYIHSIETFGAVDGPGVRFVVFMQGCPLRCLFCHNPDSWKIKDGKLVSLNSLVREIKKYKNYIEGVTLSGGEPLMQPKFTFKLVKKIKKLGLNVAIDTSGSIPLNITKKIIDLADYILLDIKGLDNDLNIKITGMSNENTLKTLNYCEEINKSIWIRQVVVPGLTLSEDYLTNLAKFLTSYKNIKSVDLLPFHKFGEFKWKELGEDYKLYETPEPTREEIIKAREIFAKYNLPIVM